MLKHDVFLEGIDKLMHHFPDWKIKRHDVKTMLLWYEKLIELTNEEYHKNIDRIIMTKLNIHNLNSLKEELAKRGCEYSPTIAEILGNANAIKEHKSQKRR